MLLEVVVSPPRCGVNGRKVRGARDVCEATQAQGDKDLGSGWELGLPFLHFASFQEQQEDHQHLRGRLSRDDFQPRALSNMLGIGSAASTGSVGMKNQCHMQVDLCVLLWEAGTNTSGLVWCVSAYALTASTRAVRLFAQVSSCKMELDKFMEEVLWHGAKKSTGTNFT